MKASEAIEKYISLRDELAKRKKAFEAEMLPLKNQMDRIEGKFLELFNKMGTDNMTVRGIGTAFKSTSSSATVADKEVFFNHVKETEEWNLMEVRAAKTQIDAYIEQHQTPPPGVNYSTTVNVRIQRSN